MTKRIDTHELHDPVIAKYSSFLHFNGPTSTRIIDLPKWRAKVVDQGRGSQSWGLPWKKSGPDRRSFFLETRTILIHMFVSESLPKHQKHGKLKITHLAKHTSKSSRPITLRCSIFHSNLSQIHAYKYAGRTLSEKWRCASQETTPGTSFLSATVGLSGLNHRKPWWIDTIQTGEDMGRRSKSSRAQRRSPPEIQQNHLPKGPNHRRHLRAWDGTMWLCPKKGALNSHGQWLS